MGGFARGAQRGPNLAIKITRPAKTPSPAGPPKKQLKPIRKTPAPPNLTAYGDVMAGPDRVRRKSLKPIKSPNPDDVTSDSEMPFMHNLMGGFPGGKPKPAAKPKQQKGAKPSKWVNVKSLLELSGNLVSK